MNPQDLIDIKNTLSILDGSIKAIESTIHGLKLTSQKNIFSNPTISPGVSCKIAYDSKGLVINGSDLIESDIPNLSIDKIDGLQSRLDENNYFSDIHELKSKIEQMNTTKNTIKPGTGTKINYNEYGIITSSSTLLPVDIPNLSIDKIDGLKELLSTLEDSLNLPTDISGDPITPGTFTKITYNADGKVVSGSKLSMDDLPISLINRVSVIESQISNFISQEVITGIMKEINHKLDRSASHINKGAYTKLTVDQNGLVVHGEQLTLSDIPPIQITDIYGLNQILKNKAELSDLINLSDTVSSMINSNQSSELINIKNQLEKKVNASEVKTLDQKVQSIQNTVNSLSVRLPSDRLLDEIKMISDILSNLTGRIIVLEQKMNVYGT